MTDEFKIDDLAASKDTLLRVMEKRIEYNALKDSHYLVEIPDYELYIFFLYKCIKELRQQIEELKCQTKT